MYLCLCLLGIPLGIGVNLFVDRFGWERRRRSLVRPTGLCVIALCALALPLLYGWEIDARMLSQERMAVAQAGIAAGPRESLVLRFLVHAFLFTMLLAATLIDFEDMIIPDILTVSGTLAGLCIAFILPGVFLPATDYFPLSDGQPVLFPSSLYWCTPRDLAVHVPMVPIRPGQVVVALLLWYGWCFAMLNRTWYGRLGFRRAWLLFWRRLHRCPTTKRYAFLALLGSVLIPWAMLSGDLFRAHALFTALIGTAVGGGLVWGVRLIAGRVLRREAMGFGDVTFMAMIGAFAGWQPCLLIFFLAPFAGVLIGAIGFLVGRGSEIPYGPYLALATVATVLFWPRVWLFTESFFALGALVPLLLLLCLVMLGVLLAVWQRIKTALFYAEAG